MFLTGSFSEYPFGELLEIFLNKRETGLLEVSSPQQSGHFYIRNGEIKDGELGKLRGAAAIELAGTLEDGSFKFKRLDSTEYAQVVWQRSFGLSNVTAEVDSFSVRAILKQVPSYPIEAYSVLETAVLWLGQRALPPLLVYLGSAYRSLKKARVLIARRISSFVNAKIVDFSRWAPYRKTPVPLVPPMLSERQSELRRYLALGQEPRLALLARGRNAVASRGGAARECPGEFVHSETHTTLPRSDRRSVVLLSLLTSAFIAAVQKVRPYGATAARNLRDGGNLIVSRTLLYAPTVWQLLKRVQVRIRFVPSFSRAEAAWRILLRTPKQIIFKTACILNNARELIQARRAQTNASFALIVLVLLVGTTVSITKILRNNDQPNKVISKEESGGAQPEAKPKTPRRRVKRIRRSGKQTPNKKQKIKDTETAVVK